MPSFGNLFASLTLQSASFMSGIKAAQKELKETQKTFAKVGAKMAKIGTVMSLAITAPVVAFGAASFKAASDAAEMESAFDVSFGNSAASVRKWAEETGNALGRSTQEMMSMSASFQDILKKQMDPGAATELSQNMTLLTRSEEHTSELQSLMRIS